MNTPLDSGTIFFIGGMGDIDLATNQSLINTIRYLSEFGYRIHYFGAFPAHYRILQDPKKIFSDRVIFHRSPDFLTPLFDFGKWLKDTLGMPHKNAPEAKRLRATQVIQYYDEYNFFGRLFYIVFQFLYTPIEMLRVSLYCFKIKPDLFYGINGIGSVGATFLGRLHRVPVLQRWHGCSYTEEHIKRIQTSWFEKFLTLDGGFAKWLPSDAVVVTNDGSQGEKRFRLIGVPPEKIHFWMNGMDQVSMSLPAGWDAKKFKESLGISGKKAIMMASRLVLWKRVDRGIDCLHRLVYEHGVNDALLIILGEGQEKESLQKLTKELKVENYVKFQGSVPHKDIAQYYSAADVFMNLYDFSNLGNPVLEAMCWGLPIASIDDGSTEELLQNNRNAVLVHHENLETELPLRVKELLENPLLRQRLGSEAKKTFQAKVMSWKDRMALEHELIQKLIGRCSEITPHPTLSPEGRGYSKCSPSPTGRGLG